MDFKGIDFTETVAIKGKKSSSGKPRKEKRKIPIDGVEVKFNRKTLKLYVVIDDKDIIICNHLQLTGELEVRVFSIPIANDKHEDWYETKIKSDKLFDRLELLKPYWASFKEGSIVIGSTMGNEYNVTGVYEI